MRFDLSIQKMLGKKSSIMEMVESASAVNDGNYSGGLEELNYVTAGFICCAKPLFVLTIVY